MNPPDETLRLLLPAGSLLPLLVDFTWKVICISVVTIPLLVILRRSSASIRHLGWLLALAMMLAAPVLSVFFSAKSGRGEPAASEITRRPAANPGHQADSRVQDRKLRAQRMRPVSEQELVAMQGETRQSPLDSDAQQVEQRVPPAQQTVTQRLQLQQPVMPAPLQSSLSAEPDAGLTETGVLSGEESEAVATKNGVIVFSLRQAELVAAGVWLAGVMFFGVRMLLAQLALRRMLRQAASVSSSGAETSPSLPVATDLISQSRLTRNVRLLTNDRCSMPMTCGVFRPAILLPKSAADWNAERMRMVILHELAHVRRLDCLWQWLSFAVTTCHWFNPLVWLAASRLRIEREQACDDEVLNSGIRPSDYAETLLDISTGGRRNVFSLCAGVAMARSHRLSRRVHAIVDHQRNRRAITSRVSVIACVTAILLLVPLGLFARTDLVVEPQDSPVIERRDAAHSRAGNQPAARKGEPRPRGGKQTEKGTPGADRGIQKGVIRPRRDYSSISLPGPGHSYLRSSEDHSALVEASLNLLDSTTGTAGTSGYRDSSLKILFSPARSIQSSLGRPADSRPRSFRISRLYIDVRNVFGPDEVHTEIDGARQNFRNANLKAWVAFRRELDRVRYRRPRPVVPATGEWSRTVNGLQARLSVDNWRDPMIAVFLELRNRRNLLNAITVPISPERLKFQLRDESGNPVTDAGLPRSGPVANLRDVQLPFDSSLRFNISVSGVGIDTSANAMIPLQSHAWVIRSNDFSTYRLSASLSATRLRGQDDTVWDGTLQIPPVAIRPASRKRAPDATVTKTYDVTPGLQPHVLKTLKEMFEDEENIKLAAATEPNRIRATAAGSRHLFLSELIEAINAGSSSQQVESRRVWLRDYAFPQDQFTFVRVRYNVTQEKSARARWATDYPEADRAFSSRLAAWTSLDVDPKGKVLDLTDPELSSFPFVYLAEPGRLVLTEEEVAALRNYLTNGGFLMADDFWGEAEWLNLKTQIQRVLPELKPVDLPLTHELFRSVFPLKEKPQVCSVAMALHGREQGITWERPDGRQVHYWGLTDPHSGRLMAVLCHNTDLADGWERGQDDAWYAEEFSEKRAYPMGINIVFHALTQK